MRPLNLTIIVSLALVLMPLSTNAFGISPDTIDLMGDRGEVLSNGLSIINTDGSDREYYLGFLDFAAADEGGSPSFTAADRTAGMSAWVEFQSPAVTVPAYSKADVPFVVRIPPTVASGAYRTAITVSPAPADVVAQNGAVIEAKTAMLLFLTVKGETQEKLELLDFIADEREENLPPTSFQLRVQNQGNVHVVPSGTVSIEGPFGQMIDSYEVNKEGGRILPGTTRAFVIGAPSKEMGWYETAKYQLGHLALGRMVTRLDLTYGDGSSLASTIQTGLIPWELLELTSAALLVTITAYLIARRMGKR